jgi:hypothetical protein
MTAPYVPSILVDAVIEALALFIAPFVGNAVGNADSPTPIVRAQVNRVPMPITGFVELRDLLQKDISTPVQIQNPSTDPALQQATISTPTQIDVQVDVYGPNASDWTRAILAVFRSEYAPDQFPAGIAPLYCSDGHQLPLVTGEEQYLNRYVFTASLEYNPDVIIPQQSATALEINILEDLQ